MFQVQSSHHVPVVAAQLMCGKCLSWTVLVVLLETSSDGLQHAEWLLQQFPLSASTCISVLQGCSLPCHQRCKADLIRAGNSETAPASLLSPLFAT